MTTLFESKRWNHVKNKLTEGQDLLVGADGSKNDTKKQVMETVLENTRREAIKMMEAASLGSTSAGGIAALNRVILPVIRRVMPTVIANEIIGVQPMTSNVAQIHTLRVQYADTVPAGGGGTTNSVTEVFSPLDIARYYSGNENPAAPAGAPTGTLEGRMGNGINIRTLRKIVEAKSRKLSATWTFEAAQDAQANQGLDIEAEIMNILATEITAEIDQEILFALRALPGAPSVTFNQANATGVPTFIGDVHASLATLINYQANNIAYKTRRGAGNWVVLSPIALTVLQSGGTSGFARTTEGQFDAPTNTRFAGVLNGAIKVYTDQLANASTPILVGYKGSEIDAAAYYCPYVPLLSTGSLINPNTGEAVVSFMTRYGLAFMDSTADSLGNSADYLGLIGIDDATLTFY